MVNSRDVARAAGVSQATVSRVLADSPKVRASTRERVLKALAEVGYVPSAPARAMRTQRTGAIGIVVSGLTNPFYPELLRILSNEMNERQLQMVVWDEEGAGEATAIHAIGQRVVDGVIFTTVTAASAPLREALRRNAPVMLLIRGLEGVACDQVANDNRAAATHIASYFVGAGRKRPALVTGPAAASTSSERVAGFRAGLLAAGVGLPDDYVYEGEFSHATGVAAFRELMRLPEPPDSVFCVNDVIALGVMDGAWAAGVRVPDDLWVVGHDDIAMASWDIFSLTTVSQPLEAMASQALELLLQRIADPGRPPRTTRFSGNLVVRRSTADTVAPPL